MRIGDMFHDYRIVVFENDSADETRTLLERMDQENDKILLVKCPSVPDCKFDMPNLYDYGLMHRNRIDRMTFFRNVYMSIVHRHFATYDYLCVLDFDLDGVIPTHGFVHALACPLPWSCICVNGRSSVPGTFGLLTTMYDAMAFCESPDDFKIAKSTDRGMGHLLQKYLRLMWRSNVSKSSPFLPVMSAFNGVAIYRMTDVRNLYYVPGYACEHISLHEQLVRRHKPIYIDLEFELYTAHQGPKSIQPFLY